MILAYTVHNSLKILLLATTGTLAVSSSSLGYNVERLTGAKVSKGWKLETRCVGANGYNYTAVVA